ncbi:hypothetical protein [Bacillus sp. Marseille-P3800]|uniref:hypothetical protein n=1 Tax=Bacillus sp. Marseille-P3800 TaxID=2014782 RepID=UPI000C06DB8D|nr:hypothetical protein [Bacillus sp. Marseille-P3800]
MKILLADNTKLKLEHFKKSNKRIYFINKHILQNDDSDRNKMNGYTYKEFYNSLPCSSNKDEKAEINARWIGRMNTQKSRHSDHMKQSLDIMASYILFSNEFSQEKNLEQYFAIQRKQLNELTQEEMKFKEVIEENFIYLRDINCFFYINKKYENFIRRRIREFKGIIAVTNNSKGNFSRAELKSYEVNILPISEVVFRLSRLELNLSELENLKEKARKFSANIERMNKETEALNSNLFESYNRLNIEKDTALSKEILNLINEIKQIKDEARITEYAIADLYSDYNSMTEMHLNFD